MSKLAQDIVLRPVITEESMQGIALNKYTFQVAKDANKVEIAQAVERSIRSMSAASSAGKAVTRATQPLGKRRS